MRSIRKLWCVQEESRGRKGSRENRGGPSLMRITHQRHGDHPTGGVKPWREEVQAQRVWPRLPESPKASFFPDRSRKPTRRKEPKRGAGQASDPVMKLERASSTHKPRDANYGAQRKREVKAIQAYGRRGLEGAKTPRSHNQITQGLASKGVKVMKT